MKPTTCCFTGHRHMAEEPHDVEQRLEAVILALIDEGIRFFGAGGAMGFDMLAAKAVLRLRERYPHIRLILVLPCADQTKYWPQEAVAEYEAIRRRADKVVCLQETYTNGCMQRRNRFLVDHSQVCVAYCREERGGTAYTVRHAKKKGLHVVNIA